MPIAVICSLGAEMCYEGEIEGYRIHAQIMDHPSRRALPKGVLFNCMAVKRGCSG